MQHILDVLPKDWKARIQSASPATIRDKIPELNQTETTDAFIIQNQAALLEYVRQQKICAHCQGFDTCGKDGDMQGFTQVILPYSNQFQISVQRCQPFKDNQLKRRVDKWAEFSGGTPQDGQFQFSNFPLEQSKKYPKLLQFAKEFANAHEVGVTTGGLYLFGPPGVGKTHLLLAVLNRLQERHIPCLFVRSDSIFDRMRHIIADNGDLEPFLEACATVPVLGIDEFAQERANDFTLEKLFRIVNYRFHAKLPTWFTSNYAPPSIYKKGGDDINDVVAPLRSRVMQMCKLAKLDGDDARQRNLESLT